MTDDLVKRLRTPMKGVTVQACFRERGEAAARIERLEAALREIATGPDHNVDAQIARAALAKLEKEEGK